jgi:hypothetical protein
MDETNQGQPRPKKMCGDHTPGPGRDPLPPEQRLVRVTTRVALIMAIGCTSNSGCPL